MMYNILVVDDDKEIVESIEIFLRNEGYNIYKAYNGLEALDILVNKEVHLILMDIMMPKLDGIKATIKIREEKNIPIILVSAKSEDTDKIMGLNIGADDYITKPFNLLELIARVKSNLRRYITLGTYNNENVNNKEVLISGGLELNTSTKESRLSILHICFNLPKSFLVDNECNGSTFTCFCWLLLLLFISFNLLFYRYL